MKKVIKEKKTNPKVSIIIPVWNTEIYLEGALDSLVNQTFQDIEIIIVNDGSPDQSENIIKRYVKQYPDKVVSFYKDNGGLSDARNYGLKHAKGTYVMFIDSDDFVELDMCEKLYQKAFKDQSDICVCGMYDYTDERKSEIRINYVDECDGKSVEEDPRLLIAVRSYATNKLFKKELFEKSNILFPVGQKFEDSAVIYNLCYYAKKISLLHDCLYYYRKDISTSITNTVNEKIFDIFKSCQNIINFYKSKQKFEEFSDELAKICSVHLFARIEKFDNVKNRKLTNKYINETFRFLNKNFPNWKRNRYIFPNTSTIKKKFEKILKTNSFLLKMYFNCHIGRIIKKKPKENIEYYEINKERLRELQLTELKILKTIDNICKKNKITYYLGEGTLLGAVRHKGFIPWDDDLDILMPREDYDKFIDIFGKNVIDNCVMCNDKTIEDYHLVITKIVALDDNGFENCDARSMAKCGYSGPFVDIFPLDKGPHFSKKLQKMRKKMIRAYRDILLMRVKYPLKKTLKRSLIKPFSRFFSNKYLHRKIKKLMIVYNTSDADYIINYTSSYPIERQTVPKEYYGKPKYVKFEGLTVPIPENSEAILTQIYGDYMTLPPEEKRVNKHKIRDNNE